MGIKKQIMAINQVIDIRTNILYYKDKEEFKKVFELVVLCHKPTYRVSTDGEIIRERTVEELRFSIVDSNLDTFIKLLSDLKKAKEDDLK